MRGVGIARPERLRAARGGAAVNSTFLAAATLTRLSDEDGATRSGRPPTSGSRSDEISCFNKIGRLLVTMDWGPCLLRLHDAR